MVSNGPHFFFRLFLTACLLLALSHRATISSALAANGFTDGETVSIERVQIEGLVHTKQETILRLLPRSLPAEFTQAEVEEFERRVQNLGLFDRVQVTRDGRNVAVDVQEKITLAPILNFTSGTSVKDLNATVGLVEYNLFGTGTQLGGQFNYSQRGPNVDFWLSQHAYEPERGAKEIKGSYNVNGIRFADSASTWTRNRIGASSN
jgi:outer membrane protein assembly factor BamA